MAATKWKPHPADAGIPLDELVAIRALTCRVWAAVAEIKSGFDPSQPRDPAGSSTGGQWSGGGAGGGLRNSQGGLLDLGMALPRKISPAYFHLEESDLEMRIDAFQRVAKRLI